MARTGARGRRRNRRAWLGLGLAPVIIVSAGVMPADAAEGDAARAAARFLAGQVLGLDLDEAADLAGVEVENAGEPEPVTAANPLDLTVLDALQVELPDGAQLPLSDVVQLGAVNQWATAEDGATSHAATGAVADSGGIGTGAEAGFPADATIHLADLVGAELTELVADVKVELAAVSSEARLVAPDSADGAFEVSRDYEIGSGALRLEIPAVADLVPKIQDAVGTADETLGSLVGPDGTVTGAVSGLEAVISLLELIGAEDVEVTSALEADLQATVDELVNEPLGADGIEVNLAAGTVVVDLDTLFGGLNDQPPNTPLVTPEVADKLVTQLGAVLDGLAQQVVDRVDEALRSARLDVSITATVTDPLLGTPLGELDLALSDSLGAIVDGEAAFVDNSTGTVPTLIAPVLEPTLAAVLDVVASTVDSTVFADGGVVTTLGETVSGLFSGLSATLAPVGDVLESVVSITLNAQSDPAGTERMSDGPYAVTAIEVTAVAAEPVATVALATSTVGENTVADAGLGQARHDDAGAGAGAGGAEYGGGAVGSVDDAGLPDTGSSSNQLVVLGVAMMLAGGIAAYAVSRGRGIGHQ